MLKGKIREITIKTFNPSNIFPKIENLVKLLYDNFQVDINISKAKHESVGQVEIQVIKMGDATDIMDIYVALVLMARISEAKIYIGEEYFYKDASRDHILGLLRKQQ